MSEQESLFVEQKAPTVGTLNAIVMDIMKDEKWRMPYEICDIILSTKGIRISDSSCTARLRDARKHKFGRKFVEKRIREGSKAYEYRILNDAIF